MPFNLSGLFALPAHCLMGAVREREAVRGKREESRKREKDRQLSTGGKAALSLRACQMNAEEGQSGELLLSGINTAPLGGNSNHRQRSSQSLPAFEWAIHQNDWRVSVMANMCWPMSIAMTLHLHSYFIVKAKMLTLIFDLCIDDCFICMLL